VTEGDSILTYGELNARASRLCGYFQGVGVKVESPVVLFVSRSLDMIVALIAALKSGGTYVPLDPATPASRARTIISELHPAIVLTDSSLAATIADCGAPTLLIDGDWLTLTDESAGRSVSVDGEALCYIIYTSGSSGAPKGVAVRHASLARYVQAVRCCYETDRDDRVLQFASLSFDASAEEIYVPLVSGACLIIYREQATTSSTALIRECGERMITHLSLPTAYWHAIASDLSSADWDAASSLRLAVIGGENARTDKMYEWTARAGNK